MFFVIPQSVILIYIYTVRVLPYMYFRVWEEATSGNHELLKNIINLQIMYSYKC